MTKKLFSILAITLFFQGALIYGQQKITVEQKVPEWAFEDAERTDFTMNSWTGKVLQINYVDPDDSDLNDGLNDYINKATTIDKRIDRQQTI